MLCETCDDLEHALIPGRSTLERVRGLQDWWNKHQALDFQRKRAEQEKQKQEALLSLRAEIDRTESQIKQIRKLGGEPTTKKLKQLETLMQKLARQK
jgi:organic radical activating enzyme